MKLVTAYLIGNKVYSNSKEAFDLNESQGYGERVEGKIYYMPEEAFLLKKKKKKII